MPPRRNAESRPRKSGPASSPTVTWCEIISQELERAKRLFVLGIGNKRKGDDAAGNLFVRLFKREMARKKRSADSGSAGIGRPGRPKSKSPPLELRGLDAGETPESSTGLIRKFRPTHVLIVDAALGGHQPGTIFVIDKENIRQEDLSTHRIPLALLVRYLEETIGCRVILVGIEPKEIAWGIPASSAVKTAAARLAGWLAETLLARHT
jgi:hydrogenase 3 maturation protease